MINEKVLQSFGNKNVVVTGGTGLIGRQVVRILCDAGAQVRVVSLDRVKVDTRADHVLGDLTSFGFCKKVTKNMDFVFHLAGIKGSIEVTLSKPASFFVPLLMFNTNILEACRLERRTEDCLYKLYWCLFQRRDLPGARRTLTAPPWTCTPDGQSG